MVISNAEVNKAVEGASLEEEKFSGGIGGWGGYRTSRSRSRGGREILSEGQGSWGGSESVEGGSLVKVKHYLEA